MTAEATQEIKVPLLGIVNLPESGKFEDLPESDWPYFVPTKTGWFLHKPVLYGTAFVPLKAWPERINMPENDNPKGVVKLNNTRFPGYILSQAVDFFTRIYDRHHTEAAVVVTHNRTTQGWRLFIPEQYVGHGGVQQRWEQEHLAEDWYAVGTIHSHCDFGAFHSGTDVGDANDFDGMHITIGHLKREAGPEFAQMLMINKCQIDLTVDQAIDWGQMDGPKTAPTWWDRYVHPNGTAPWNVKPPTQFSQASRPYEGNGFNWQRQNGGPQKTYQDPPKVSVETHLILDNGGAVNRKFLDKRVTDWNPRTSTGTVGGTYGKSYVVTVPAQLPAGFSDWEHWWGEKHWVASKTRDPNALLPDDEPIQLTEGYKSERQKQKDAINAAYKQAEIDWMDEEWWDRHGASPVSNLPSKQTPLKLTDESDSASIELLAELKQWGIDTDDDLIQYARDLLGQLDANLQMFGYELTDWEINDLRGDA